MIMHVTDCAWATGAVSSRRPLSRVCRSKVVIAAMLSAVAGNLTRAAIEAQPEWLREVPTEVRLPAGRVLFTGCGTSFHAAQTGGEAVQALDVVDGTGTLVALSHEGETWSTVEAVRRWSGPKWAVTAAPESTIARLCEEVVVAAPELEQSWCHTASYTCAVATLAVLRGEDVSWLPDMVERALGDPFP